jgi:hypothetical protein
VPSFFNTSLKAISGVVYKDVNPAVLFDCGINHRFDLFIWLGDIKGECQSSKALELDELRGITSSGDDLIATGECLFGNLRSEA